MEGLKKLLLWVQKWARFEVHFKSGADLRCIKSGADLRWTLGSGDQGMTCEPACGGWNVVGATNNTKPMDQKSQDTDNTKPPDGPET